MKLCGMIKKIKGKILLWSNHQWINSHRRELYKKYDGKWVLVSGRKVVAIADNDRDLLPQTKPGDLFYLVPLNIDKWAERTHFFETAKYRRD